MPDEKPAGGGGSDPYGGGYSFGPFLGDQRSSQPGAWQPVGGPGGGEEQTQPYGWQPGGGQGGEPTQRMDWEPDAQEEAAESTQPLHWAPVGSSGPEAMQFGGYGAPAGGPPPGALPGPPAGAPAPRRPNRLVIMAAVVIAALMLTGVGVGIAIIGSRASSGAKAQDPTGRASKPASQNPTAAPAASLASGAVRGYLEAVAAGNARGALAYAAQLPPQSGLLTDAVLAESKRRGPITAIDVPAVNDQNATSVTATYKIGSTNVSHTYQVVRVADSQWKLVAVTTPIEIDYQPAAGMKINGAKINSALLELFPGSYTINSSSKYVTVDPVKFVVKGASIEFDRHRTPASLTGAGKKRATSAAKKDLNRCLDTKAIAPKNCPFGVRAAGYKNTKSTIRWTVVGNDPFDKAKVRLADDDAIVSSIRVRIRFSSSCTRNGVPYLCSADIDNNAWATVPLADPSKVRWSATKR
jgi:hypothetical protein